MNAMSNEGLKTRARNIFLKKGVIRYDERFHLLLDFSRLKSIPDDELKGMRQVGATTIEFINEFRKLFEWL